MSESVIPGIFKHYKGQIVCVVAVCTDRTNARAGEKAVIYYDLMSARFFTRLWLEFNESVRWADGKFRARFVPLEGAPK